MKLYLSSIDIPVPAELAKLLGKPLSETSVALIPNAQDYYSDRARAYKIAGRVADMTALGFKVAVVDLQKYTDVIVLKVELSRHDLVWVMGGNTFCLRYEMHRSGFDAIIADVLNGGVVFGGDSAGAIVTGPSIAGIESADIPGFAPEVIETGLNLVPQVALPHVDNPEFTEAAAAVRALHHGKTDIIELKDSQAVIFDGKDYRVVG